MILCQHITIQCTFLKPKLQKPFRFTFLLFFFSPKHIVRPDYVGRSRVPDWPDYIEIKDQEQIEGLARACQLARHVLLLAGRSLRVGGNP